MAKIARKVANKINRPFAIFCSFFLSFNLLLQILLAFEIYISTLAVTRLKCSKLLLVQFKCFCEFRYDDRSIYIAVDSKLMTKPIRTFTSNSITNFAIKIIIIIDYTDTTRHILAKVREFAEMTQTS